MYEYSDSISDPFFTSAQAMTKQYTVSKYTQFIQDIPQAIDIHNSGPQAQNFFNNTFKLDEKDFERINKDNITYLQNNCQGVFSWNDVPQFSYSTSMKNKMESIESSTKNKIEQQFSISKEYFERSKEIKKFKYPVPILYKGLKVAESYIGYSIECPIGNDSQILLSRFIIHGTTTRPIFTFCSLQSERFYSSSENFFEAFQSYKNLIFNFRIFNGDVPALASISPLKFVQIRPFKNEYYSITFDS